MQFKKQQTFQPASLKDGHDPREQDPYLLYGFGIVAYFDLMKMLMLLFTVLSLLAVPSIYLFSSYSGIPDARGYATFSLGNMGYNGPECFQSPLATDSIILKCDQGAIAEVLDIGLIPKQDHRKD